MGKNSRRKKERRQLRSKIQSHEALDTPQQRQQILTDRRWLDSYARDKVKSHHARAFRYTEYLRGLLGKDEPASRSEIELEALRSVWHEEVLPYPVQSHISSLLPEDPLRLVRPSLDRFYIERTTFLAKGSEYWLPSPSLAKDFLRMLDREGLKHFGEIWPDPSVGPNMHRVRID